MQRLKRRLFKTKKSIEIEREDEEVYLEPQFSETESITLHIDSVAEELLAIAKKSSHTIRLSKLYDELLLVKTKITRKLTENSKDLFNANRQIEILKKTSETEREGSLSTRYNRSFASDHSMADVRNILTTEKTESVSCHSIWSPTNSILSSSITTPTFRRRLAETSISDINHSSVIQEHFVYLNQQLCSNCSKCSCYQTFIRNQIELEYLSICSYNEQLKSENDLLQRLLADCKYSYEKQYVRFSQYEQYLIEYEQCIQIQYELIRTFQQLIDRFQITIDKRKRNDDDNQNNNNHIYQKINETTSGLINQESEHIELYRLITSLYEQCQRHISQLPKRAQLFSYSHEEFHPPPNISGVVDVADLEISVLFVDLLTLKHENSELRWYNERLLREKKVSKTKVDLYELTNKYFQSNNDEMNSTHDELIQREKTLRLYVHRLYDLLETTSNQLKERQIHEENLLYQFRLRNRELIEQIRRFRRSS